MDGTEWLDRVLTPALENGGRTGSILHAQVQALRECGVLDAGRADDAVRRIEAGRPEIGPPATAADPPVNRLRQVLAPALPLADVDRVTYVLTSVELWEHSVDVFVAGVPSAVTADRERAAGAALDAWAARGHRDGGPPPDAMRSFHLGVLIGVSDDAGTAYEMRHASSGGSGTPWRMHVNLTPGVPAAATSLTIHVRDDDGRPSQQRTIDLGTGRAAP